MRYFKWSRALTFIGLSFFISTSMAAVNWAQIDAELQALGFQIDAVTKRLDTATKELRLAAGAGAAVDISSSKKANIPVAHDSPNKKADPVVTIQGLQQQLISPTPASTFTSSMTKAQPPSSNNSLSMEQSSQ